MPTKIEWTDEVWNIVTGCSPVSEGCDHCYARRMAQRLRGRFGYPQNDPFAVTLHPDRLEEPLHWVKPRMVFVCSMGDLFHPRVPWEFINKVFAVMALAKQHTFQILTKRPGRMAWYLTAETPLLPRENFPHARPVSRPTRIGWAAQGWAEDHGAQRDLDKPWEWLYPLPRRYEDIVCSGGMDEWLEWPLPNVWAGTSVESAKYLPRLDVLARVPAPVRFVSLEPLLGLVDLRPWLQEQCPKCREAGCYYCDCDDCRDDGESVLQWVILGGESGLKARRLNIQWLRSVVGQCEAAGVPCFVKQDSGLRAGMQGRIPDDLWALKEFPNA